MAIVVNSRHQDAVIDSIFLTGQADYRFALENFFPLISRFDAQRKLQDQRFYKRLERDLILGCIMPPITLAFINSEDADISTIDKAGSFINANIANAYILDGIQRINTLKRASTAENFDATRPILVNVIISKAYDPLLYRMITLNNGARPMTARHQIEILTKELFDFSRLNNISVQSEKERGEKIVRGAFNLGEISSAYLAHLTDNVNNENNKIIEEKMNEILVSRVMDSGVNRSGVDFKDIVTEIDRLCENEDCRRWLKVSNNLIGFAVGIKKSYDYIRGLSPAAFSVGTAKFDEAFDALNPSKVNLGRYRRELSRDFIAEFERLETADSDELIEYMVNKTLTE
jgi:hypothetical protein